MPACSGAGASFDDCLPLRGCKFCADPFAGIGGLVLRHVGFARSPGNPSLCTKCLGKLRKQGMNGVEIPVTLLFSDVRGSTALGEQMPATDFHAFLERFYRLASEAIIGHDGLVDKVVGDEVVALFFGGISGPDHAAAALAAAIDVAERTARPDATPFRWELRCTRARRSWEGPARAARSRTSPRWGMWSIPRRDSHRQRARAR
jgi:hypothetical protein